MTLSCAPKPRLGSAAQCQPHKTFSSSVGGVQEMSGLDGLACARAPPLQPAVAPCQGCQQNFQTVLVSAAHLLEQNSQTASSG